MTITIIVPVYGVERYIRECAVSLFSQTYEDIEYIFCDDCTPDRSIDVLREVMAEYPERKVRIIRNEINRGLGGTRQHLISEIKTEYFMIVDSDDLLPNNAVEVLVNRMKETNTDIVDAGYAEYASGQTGMVTMPCHDIGQKYLNKVLCNNLVSLRVWGKLYKTSVIGKVPEIFVQGIDYAEDVCFSSRVIAIASRSWTDDVVYFYRTDNISSYTNNLSEKNILSYLRACNMIQAFYRQRGLIPFALEIGMLNAYRECRRRNVSVDIADKVIGYKPKHLRARFLFRLLRTKLVPLIVSDYVYRLFRAMACQ